MAVILKPNPVAPIGLNPDEINAKKSALQTIGTATPQAPATSSQAPANRQQQGSGRFTNVQKYLQANQGGGQKIANNIQGQFDKNAQNVSEGIQNAQSQLQNKVNPLQTQLGEQGSQQLKAGFVDPNAVLQDQAKLNDFRNLQQGYGTNIQNIAGTEAVRQQQLQGQAAKLSEAANMANSEQGRFQLLRNTLGSTSGGYSQGSQRLDQLLLGGQPNVTRNLQSNLMGTVNSQKQSLSGLEQDRMNRLNSLRNLSGQRKSEWQGLLEGGTGEGLETNLQERGLGDIKASSEAALKQSQDLMAKLPELRTRLATGQITPEEAQLLGLNYGTNLWDVDPNQFMSQTQFNPDITSTANPEEVKRYNMLRQLAGQAQSGGGIFGEESQAGTFKPFNYDVEGLNQAIAKSQEDWRTTKMEPALGTLQSFLPAKKWNNPLYDEARRLAYQAKTPEELQNAFDQYIKYYGDLGVSAPTKEGVLAANPQANLINQYLNDYNKRNSGQYRNLGMENPKNETPNNQPLPQLPNK